MAYAEFDSKNLLGVQDSGAEQLMLKAGRPGWLLFQEVIGHDPDDRSSKDYAAFRELGFRVMVQLVNGVFPEGTLPGGLEYSDFATRCANFVAGSRGCHHWIIGNEMNYAASRPGVQALADQGLLRPTPGDPFLQGAPQRHNAVHPTAVRTDQQEIFAEAGEAITPERYARCYRLCRRTIQRLPGRESDLVLLGAVAPWNTHTTYQGNAQGDWVRYFQDILLLIGPNECDGITLHAHTHGADPALIRDDSRLTLFPQHAYHFQIYRDFMAAIPTNMRSLPVYITQVDQGGPWADANRSWIQAAAEEIRDWNREPNSQKIHALIFYRWQAQDDWHMEGKPGVMADFALALGVRDREQTGPDASRLAAPLASPFTPEAAQPRASAFGSPEIGDWLVGGRGISLSQPALVTPEASGLEPHRAQWLRGRLPKQLYAGQTIPIALSVRNIGNTTWPRGGERPVRVGYRFFRNQKEIPLPAEERIWAALSEDVLPDHSTDLHIDIALPEEPGNYTILIDLIQEGGSWFHDLGSDALMRWLTVLPPEMAPASDPAPQSAPGSAQPISRQNGQGMVTQVATPLIQDVRDQLPRRGAGLPRPLEQVRRLVLHHTGAPPVIPLANLAKAHVDSGYPAIAFHYFVRVNGEILQTCDLNEVMSQDLWMAEGVHISLEGNFHEEAPGGKQLAAAAHLCAWLMTELPQAGQWSAQDVVGLCELIPSPSPGQTFLEGPNWRRQLHERITQMLTRESQPPTPAPRTAAAWSGEGRPPGRASALEPAILDLIAHLPREPHRFYARQPEDVQMVVVNQTGVPAETPLDAIAEGFLDQGAPGILYQYVISVDGAICQTQPLLQVVEPELPYIAQAVNVAFAGQFDNSVPNPAQIQAGGALIAWLLDYFKLPVEAVMGVQELVSHPSPGKQWMSGARWKRSLLDAVSAAMRLGQAPSTSRAAQMDARLRQRLEAMSQEHAQLQSKLSQISRQNERLATDNERLRQEIQSLRREEEALVQVEQPPMEELMDRLPRHPEMVYERRPLEQITHLAIHHTATPPTVQPERIAQLHVNADPDRGKEAWPGIGYHFFIYPDGRIARTQPLGAIVYHVAHHNASSVGIALAGSFLNGRLPTAEQLRSAAHLVAWLLQALELPLEQVWGHQEFEGNNTVCPGTEWLRGRRWRDELLDLVVAFQTGREQ